MAFSESPRFPDDISKGSTFGPGWNTSIVTLDSGAEERNARWSQAKIRGNAKYGVTKRAQWSTLLEFARARSGPADGFRIKDFTDYSTAADGKSAPTSLDQSIGTGDGVTTQFQLVKRYASGAVTAIRNLRKPVPGTTTVSLNGVTQITGWNVDTTTGIVTFTTPGFGVAVAAGCQFDVPVRFGAVIDQGLVIHLEHDELGEVPDIPFEELLDEAPTQDGFFYGGGADVALSASGSFTRLTGRAIRVTPSVGSLSYTETEPVSGLATGGPYFFLINGSGSNAILIKDQAGNTIVNLLAGNTRELWLIQVGGSKQWMAF